MKKLTLSALASTVAGTAMAHAGHDHSAASAGLVHALYYGAIAAVAGLAVYLVVKHFSKKK